MIKKTLIISLVALVLLIFSGWYYFTHHFNLLGECSRELVGEILSPLEDHVAEYYVQNCGATTDFSTRVAIDKDIVFVIKGRHVDDIGISWTNEKELSIRYSGNQGLIQSLNEDVNGIHILFEEIGADNTLR